MKSLIIAVYSRTEIQASKLVKTPNVYLFSHIPEDSKMLWFDCNTWGSITLHSAPAHLPQHNTNTSCGLRPYRCPLQLMLLAWLLTLSSYSLSIIPLLILKMSYDKSHHHKEVLRRQVNLKNHILSHLSHWFWNLLVPRRWMLRHPWVSLSHRP